MQHALFDGGVKENAGALIDKRARTKELKL
jgi:hypothetical protein